MSQSQNWFATANSETDPVRYVRYVHVQYVIKSPLDWEPALLLVPLVRYPTEPASAGRAYDNARATIA